MKGRIHSIRIKGLRSLDGLRLDLTEGMAGRPRDFALVVGENGSGKTDILQSVVFLKMTLDTALLAEVQDAADAPEGAVHGGMDLESGTAYEFRVPYGIDAGSWDLRTLADMFRTAGADEGPEVEMEFSVDGSSGRYMVRLGPDGRIDEEALDFRISSNSGNIFRLKRTDDGVESKFSVGLFPRVPIRRRFGTLIDSQWGDHTLLSLIKCENIHDGGKTATGLGTGIMDAIAFLEGIVVLTDGSSELLSDGLDPDLRSVTGGIVPEEEAPLLERYAACMTDMLRGLVSGLEDVYYLTEGEGNAVSYDLRVRRSVNGKVADISAECESKGVRRLISMFPCLYTAYQGMPVLIDDVDQNLNICLIPGFVQDARRGCPGQIVATTHSTILLQEIEPQSCFVIQTDAEGGKRAPSFPRVVRTMSNHNNRLRYEAGEFGGIPHPDKLDMAAVMRR